MVMAEDDPFGAGGGAERDDPPQPGDPVLVQRAHGDQPAGQGRVITPLGAEAIRIAEVTGVLAALELQSLIAGGPEPLEQAALLLGIAGGLGECELHRGSRFLNSIARPSRADRYAASSRAMV